MKPKTDVDSVKSRDGNVRRGAQNTFNDNLGTKAV